VPDNAARLRPANHSDGLPLTARWLTDHITAAETGGN
jgi:hypothetical protein